MAWNMQTPIPADRLVLITTDNRECAFYEDGKLTSLGDPARAAANIIDLWPSVRHLIGLAGVTLVEAVPRRLLVDEEAEGGPVRRASLSDVEAVRALFAKAATLRAEAADRIAEADRIEGR